MAVANPATILRRASTDRIAQILKRQRDQSPPIYRNQDAVGGFGGNVPGPGSIPDVGQFGTSGSLPTNPGPADFPVGGGEADPGFGPGPGSWDPDITLAPTWNSTNPLSPDWGNPNTSSGGGPQFPTGPGAMGPFPGGNMGGPQGSVYGINPVTGNTIYNATGSPRPGFLDSRTGRFVTSAGAGALNAVLPGLGSASRAIMEGIRNRNTARNTGTDLSGRTNLSGGGRQPSTANPSGPAWYQPGYQLPAGIQAAIARGDYQRAYGPSEQSITSAKIMASQAYGGNPNNTRAFASAGRFLIDEDGTPRQFGPMFGPKKPSAGIGV